MPFLGSCRHLLTIFLSFASFSSVKANNDSVYDFEEVCQQDIPQENIAIPIISKIVLQLQTSQLENKNFDDPKSDKDTSFPEKLPHPSFLNLQIYAAENKKSDRLITVKSMKKEISKLYNEKKKIGIKICALAPHDSYEQLYLATAKIHVGWEPEGTSVLRPDDYSGFENFQVVTDIDDEEVKKVMADEEYGVEKGILLQPTTVHISLKKISLRNEESVKSRDKEEKAQLPGESKRENQKRSLATNEDQKGRNKVAKIMHVSYEEIDSMSDRRRQKSRYETIEESRSVQENDSKYTKGKASIPVSNENSRTSETSEESQENTISQEVVPAENIEFTKWTKGRGNSSDEINEPYRESETIENRKQMFSRRRRLCAGKKPNEISKTYGNKNDILMETLTKARSNEIEKEDFFVDRRGEKIVDTVAIRTSKSSQAKEINQNMVQEELSESVESSEDSTDNVQEDHFVNIRKLNEDEISNENILQFSNGIDVGAYFHSDVLKSNDERITVFQEIKENLGSTERNKGQRANDVQKINRNLLEQSSTSMESSENEQYENSKEKTAKIFQGQHSSKRVLAEKVPLEITHLENSLCRSLQNLLSTKLKERNNLKRVGNTRAHSAVYTSTHMYEPGNLTNEPRITLNKNYNPFEYYSDGNKRSSRCEDLEDVPGTKKILFQGNVVLPFDRDQSNSFIHSSLPSPSFMMVEVVKVVPSSTGIIGDTQKSAMYSKIDKNRRKNDKNKLVVSEEGSEEHENIAKLNEIENEIVDCDPLLPIYYSATIDVYFAEISEHYNQKKALQYSFCARVPTEQLEKKMFKESNQENDMKSHVVDIYELNSLKETKGSRKNQTTVKSDMVISERKEEPFYVISARMNVGWTPFGSHWLSKGDYVGSTEIGENPTARKIHRNDIYLHKIGDEIYGENFRLSKVKEYFDDKDGDIVSEENKENKQYENEEDILKQIERERMYRDKEIDEILQLIEKLKNNYDTTNSLEATRSSNEHQQIDLNSKRGQIVNESQQEFSSAESFDNCESVNDCSKKEVRRNKLRPTMKRQLKSELTEGRIEKINPRDGKMKENNEKTFQNDADVNLKEEKERTDGSCEFLNLNRNDRGITVYGNIILKLLDSQYTLENSMLTVFAFENDAEVASTNKEVEKNIIVSLEEWIEQINEEKKHRIEEKPIVAIFEMDSKSMSSIAKIQDHENMGASKSNMHDDVARCELENDQNDKVTSKDRVLPFSLCIGVPKQEESISIEIDANFQKTSGEQNILSLINGFANMQVKDMTAWNPVQLLINPENSKYNINITLHSHPKHWSMKKEN